MHDFLPLVILNQIPGNFAPRQTQTAAARTQTWVVAVRGKLVTRGVTADDRLPFSWYRYYKPENPRFLFCTEGSDKWLNENIMDELIW